MRTILVVATLALLAGSADAAASRDLTLDLSNWGYGVLYLEHLSLGSESNGKGGFQDAPTLLGTVKVPGDLALLP